MNSAAVISIMIPPGPCQPTIAVVEVFSPIAVNSAINMSATDS